MVEQVEAPAGAIVGEELEALRAKYALATKDFATGYFAVEHKPLRFSIDGTFCFSWKPKDAYYFRNYLLAYGYYLRCLTERNK